MRNKTITTGLLAFALVGVVLVNGWSSTRTPSTEEHEAVIKFSHKKHVTDLSMECDVCHAGAKESTTSSVRSMPKHETCASCHGTEVEGKCEFCHNGDPQAFPETMFDRSLHFNHKLHVADQKVECVKCHATIAESDNAAALIFPAMETCSSCHNNIAAANQCESCHQNLAALWPASHTLGSFKKEHGRMVNGPDAKCDMCHTEASCAQCHDASSVSAIARGEKTGMLAARALGNDKAKPMAGETVHQPNFKFTHGIEAKGKTSDCQTCHNSKTFCNDCHNGGTENFGSIRPVSHNDPLFSIWGGYGSGGGSHAKLAHRDIESCTSCHDAEGSDPTCIRCHTDPDGAKHTNPRTHDNDFMKDTHGSWHDDAGATCYACHTDSNARPNGHKGVQFCGYCHH